MIDLSLLVFGSTLLVSFSYETDVYLIDCLLSYVSNIIFRLQYMLFGIV